MNETCLKTGSMNFTLDSEESQVKVVSRQFFEFAQKNKFENMDSMRVAFEEALINAMKHGNKYDALKKVKVELIADCEKLKVIIENEGDGFDYTEAMIKLTESQDNVYQGSGRGIFLISMYTDEFYYENNGRRIIMIKNR